MPTYFRIFSDDDPDDECNAFQFGSEEDKANSDNDGDGLGDKLEVRQIRLFKRNSSFDPPPTERQVPGADVRVPGEEARLRGGLPAELPHAGDALHPRPGDRRRPLQGQLDQDTRKVELQFSVSPLRSLSVHADIMRESRHYHMLSNR